MDAKARAANANSIKDLEAKLAGMRDVQVLEQSLKSCGTSGPSLVHDFQVYKTLTGHFGKVYSMDWGPDEKLLSGAQDGSLIVWNALTNNKLSVITLVSSWVMSCAMSPSGDLTASGGLDNMVTIYKLEDCSDPDAEQPSHRVLEEHFGYISSTAFLDDQRVLSASGDKTVILWDIESNKYLNVFEGHESDVMALSLFDGTDLFVSGSCDNTCKVWDTRDHKANVLTFPGHTQDVNAVDVSRSGNFFCSAGDDAKVLIHDIRSYGPIQSYGSSDLDAHNAHITSCAFSKSSRLIFAAYDNLKCYSWDTISSEGQHWEAHEQRVSCMGVSKSGDALGTGGWDQTLRIWA